jgi:flagellar protein FlaG
MTVEALTSVTTGPAAVSGGGIAAGAKIATSLPVAADVEKLTIPKVAVEDMSAAVRAAARQIDSYLKQVGRALEYSIDEATGRTVITVRVTATGEVIRQIPNEEVLELARHIDAGSNALLSLTA